MTGKVLVTDYVHNDLIEGLQQMGYTVDYDRTITYDNVKMIIHDYAGIVINSKVKMDATTIDLAPQLQWIARLGSGLEIIDLPYAASKGIHVYNSPEGNRNAVAEHAIGMLLCLQNQIIRGDGDVRAMAWDREARRGRELMHKTIGIIGLGNTGTALATKLRSWDMRLLAHDPYIQHPPASTTGVELVSLPYLQAQADIISLHVPLTPLTLELINSDFLSKCKHGVILMNTSRGKVVDIGAVLSSIERQMIGGLCLDVFPNEKTQTYTEEEIGMYNRLYSRDDVVLTPHVAGWTDESLQRIAEVLLWKIKADIS
jgi:D-3-phosphoglycerate dehydrogenase